MRTWLWPRRPPRARFPAIVGAGAPAAQQIAVRLVVCLVVRTSTNDLQLIRNSQVDEYVHLAPHMTSCSTPCQRQPCVVRPAVSKLVHANLDLLHSTLRNNMLFLDHKLATSRQEGAVTASARNVYPRHAWNASLCLHLAAHLTQKQMWAHQTPVQH
jgi:alkanesulfonate monooxygenase SsuD/methylene tetrahydromethanopterin reductase-like flavin-dependent oxidoreductase (luciferase family)